MSNGKMRILRTGLIGVLAVALIFTMTFTSRVTALDEGSDIKTAVANVVKEIDKIPGKEELKLTSEHKTLVEDARTAYDEFMCAHGEALQAEEYRELSVTLQPADDKLTAAE